MNLRFPEIFGFLLLASLLCSFALPRRVSGSIENSFQFLFSPVTGPIQWMAGSVNEREPVQDEPLLPEIRDDVTRLTTEKRALIAYVETLRAQLETLKHRQGEAERVGEKLTEIVQPVKVIGADANGRDVLRLAGTDLPLKRDQAVMSESGVVGQILDVGAANQASVRLVTDRGFKLLCRFARMGGDVAADHGALRDPYLPIEPTLIEGRGRGEMHIESLKMDVVTRVGLKVGDLVVLSDPGTQSWPVEVHGKRIGRITYVGEKVDVAGVAEIRVRPEVELRSLKQVFVVIPPEMMPAK